MAKKLKKMLEKQEAFKDTVLPEPKQPTKKESKKMSDQWLDFQDMSLDDTFEPEVLPKDEEAKLRIVSMLIDVDKNGKRYMMPFFETPDNPRVKEFGDYLPFPDSNTMNEKELNKAKLKIKDFGQAFDLNFSSGPIDVKNDVIGKEGWAILGIGKDQDDLPVNKIKRYVTPK